MIKRKKKSNFWFKLYVAVAITCLVIAVLWQVLPKLVYQTENVFLVRSIDTTKYSRDLAEQEMGNPDFDAVIDQQVSEIAASGANYIAIDTPYDAEFLPYLRRWVQSARDNKLHVWFRGNFSGWEGWFGYQKINRAEHLSMMHNFITKNPDLFEDGDIFTACPECENGGPGDPRQTGDISGFRKFMVSEYQMAESDFGNMGKKITANYDSMNFDVAKAVMDKPTTQQMGGIVTIDHYVKNPNELSTDINYLANISGGQIVLGEYGAPIPNINGSLTQAEQADWINQALTALLNQPGIVGLNYWTSVGGSTALWDERGNPTQAVIIIQKFYTATKKVPNPY